MTSVSWSSCCTCRQLTTEAFDRIDELRDWCRNLELRLNGLDDVSRRYNITVETLSAGGHRIDLQRFEHGLSSGKHIPREFFESAEYLAHRGSGADLERSHGPGRLRQARRRSGKTSPASRWR